MTPAASGLREEAEGLLGRWYVKSPGEFRVFRTRMYGFSPLAAGHGEPGLARRLWSRLPAVLRSALGSPGDPAKSAARLLASGAPRPFYLYVNIPFCVQRCRFCMFSVSTGAGAAQTRAYVTALSRHLELLRALVPGPLKAPAVHVGGGTPTYLPARELSSLLEGLAEGLGLSERTRWTVETSPETVLGREGLEKLRALRAGGVNRLSLGVESLEEETLRLAGRGHDAGQALEALENARRAGFSNVNVDLLLGMAAQTPAGWSRTVGALLERAPESVSLYHCAASANVAYKRLWETRRELFPSNQAIFEMNLQLLESLAAAGYRQNRPNSFTRAPEHFWYPPYLDVLSLGAGSWSFLRDAFLNYQADARRYQAELAAGRLPVAAVDSLPPGRARRMEIGAKLQFLNAGGLSRADFEARHGVSVESACGPIWPRLLEEGLVVERDGAFLLSAKGALCADEIVGAITL